MDVVALVRHTPRLRRDILDAVPGSMDAMVRTQQHRLATETMVNWMLGELENVKASMAPYKPPSTALIPFPLAKAMQWQLTSLYETHKCFFLGGECLISHSFCACALLFCFCWVCRFQYVKTLRDQRWRVKLVVVVQDVNKELHEIVRRSSNSGK